MSERTNEQWLDELTGALDLQDVALDALRTRLQSGIFYYLSRERSDLMSLSIQEINQMAEDLAQDATLRVMENLGSFRGDSRFTTWTTKFAVRVAINELRRARYKDFSLDDMMANSELLPVSSNTVNNSTIPDPENAAKRTDVMAQIQNILKESLTKRQHQALIAVVLNGVPIDIVAEQMGTNRNALYKFIRGAQRKLRSHLDEQGISVDYMMPIHYSDLQNLEGKLSKLPLLPDVSVFN